MNPADTKPSQGTVSAQIVAELARRAESTTFTPRAGNYRDAAPYVVLRDGEGKEHIHHLKERLEDPQRKTGAVKLQDTASFIAYYQIHGNGAPVYGTIAPAKFVAVLNEHTKDKAGWRDHRAEFMVALSHEWTIWKKHNGSGAAFNSNEAFALFLEDNAPDIVDPDASRMLEIALNFRVKADVQFSVAQRLQDGHIQLGYQNVVQAGGVGGNNEPLVIPEMFKIEVPVFAGLDSPKYKVDARFRYRLRDGKLTLWYELVRPHKVEEQAFKDVWQQIKDATNAPILLGTPE